jgi:hypothetical protein
MQHRLNKLVERFSVEKRGLPPLTHNRSASDKTGKLARLTIARFSLFVKFDLLH